MIAPGRRAATMRRAASCEHTNVDFRFVSSTASHVSSVSSRNGVRGKMPALFTRTSIGPRARSASATRARASSGFEMSAAIVTARRPSAVISAAADSAAALSSRKFSATSAPAAANRMAMARPMPRWAPVTRTFLPAQRWSVLMPPV